jgi:hypothetical protein
LLKVNDLHTIEGCGLLSPAPMMNSGCTQRVLRCSHHPLARTSAAPLATEADDENANGDEGRYDEMMMMKIRASLA